MELSDIVMARRPPALDAQDAAVFLDLDGTLAPIAPRPEDVGPDPRRTALIERLSQRLGGRLAVLSGRTLTDIDRILEGRVAAVAAVHGLVWRGGDGRVAEPTPHAGLAVARETFARLADRDPGLLVEDKGLSVALHYRLAPRFRDLAILAAEGLSAETGLSFQPGHMVVELRTPGPDKGDSLRRFMAEAPFAGRRPVFIGDDLTDEPAFRAAAALGGHGVLVGAERASAADWRVPDVAAVLAWLEAVR